MKKILFTIAIIITMVLSANAQDGFFRSDSGENGGYRPAADMPMVPQGYDVGKVPDSEGVPLGSGLLVLTMLGGAYMLRKRQTID